MTENNDAKSKAIRDAHSEATTTLRNNHREEYNGLVRAAVKAKGFDWKPRPTAEEKAAAEIELLLQQFPDLSTTFQKVEPQQGDPT